MKRLRALLAITVTVIATTAPVRAAAAVSLEGGHPIGSLEVAQSPEPGVLVVTGWAVDPDTDASVDIRVDVTVEPGDAPLHFSVGPASSYRPDVGASYDGVGDRHGFEARLEVPVGTGAPAVAVHAVNSPGTPGDDQLIGSQIEVDDALPDPFGALEAITATADGYVRLRGFTGGPRSLLTVWTGAKFVWASSSGVYHPLPAALGQGEDRGFDTLVGGPPYFSAGTHQICVNIRTVRLGCRTVTVVEDRFPPETMLTTVPPPTGPDRTVRLEFSSTEPGTYFFCRWGLADWTGCSSPLITTVTPGVHTFAVRSTDPWWNTDPTPASVTFRVTRPRLDVRVQAVRQGSSLRVDVDPDLPGRAYLFRVQRQVGDVWRTVGRWRTRAPHETRVLDLDAGRYRVVVPRQHGMRGAVGHARLRR